MYCDHDACVMVARVVACYLMLVSGDLFRGRMRNSDLIRRVVHFLFAKLRLALAQADFFNGTTPAPSRKRSR